MRRGRRGRIVKVNRKQFPKDIVSGGKGMDYPPEKVFILGPMTEEHKEDIMSDRIDRLNDEISDGGIKPETKNVLVASKISFTSDVYDNGEPFTTVYYENDEIGTIWPELDGYGGFDVESHITGMSWGCDTMQAAVDMLESVYLQEVYLEKKNDKT
jgi:hypothetical protein